MPVALKTIVTFLVISSKGEIFGNIFIGEMVLIGGLPQFSFKYDGNV